MDEMTTEPGEIVNAGRSEPGSAKQRLPMTEILERREKEANGDIDFELKATIPGFVGKVRRLSIVDRMAIGALPTVIQDRVVFLINAARGSSSDNAPLTLNRLMKSQGNNEDLANALCLAGFVYPRMVASEDEADNVESLYIGNVSIHDRLAYLSWCNGNDETAGGRIEPFRYQPDGPLVRVAPPAGHGGSAE